MSEERDERPDTDGCPRWAIELILKIRLMEIELGNVNPAGQKFATKDLDQLMEKLSSFLIVDGKMFIHIFTHHDLSYLYEVKDESDWMAKYFFSGGIMPSDHLLLYFADHFAMEKHWRVSGLHYSKTSEAWLMKMDSHKSEIMPLFEKRRQFFHQRLVVAHMFKHLHGYNAVKLLFRLK